MKHQTPGYFERDVVDFQQFFKKAYANAETSSQNGVIKGLVPANAKTNRFTDKKRPTPVVC